MPTQEKRIIYIDASSLVDSQCLLRFYRTVVEGWRSPKTDISMFYGTCFHKCAEEFQKFKLQFDREEAEMRAIHSAQKHWRAGIDNCVYGKTNSWMTLDHLTSLLVRYLEHEVKDNAPVLVEECWENHTEGVDCPVCHGHGKGPVVELKFAEPIYEDEDYIFILSGTIDKLVTVGSQQFYCIGDYKTTSSYNVEDYFAPYSLSLQLRVYRLAIHLLGKRYPGSIFEDIDRAGCGMFIDGVFLNKEVDKVSFQRSKILQVDQSDLYSVNNLIIRKCEDLILVMQESSMSCTPMIKDGILTGACKGNYGKLCKYFGACNTPDDISAQMVLEQHFQRKEYNPLKFGEVVE